MNKCREQDQVIAERLRPWKAEVELPGTALLRLRCDLVLIPARAWNRTETVTMR